MWWTTQCYGAARSVAAAATETLPPCSRDRHPLTLLPSTLLPGPRSRELFYQEALRYVGNVAAIELSPPAPMRRLVEAALAHPLSGWREEDGSRADIAQVRTAGTVARRDEGAALGPARVLFALPASLRP